MQCNELVVMYEEFSETFVGFCFAEFGKQFIIVNSTLSSHDQKVYKLALEYFLDKGLAPKKIALPPSSDEEMEAITYAKKQLAS